MKIKIPKIDWWEAWRKTDTGRGWHPGVRLLPWEFQQLGALLEQAVFLELEMKAEGL